MKAIKTGKKKYYAVKVGGAPGVYETWDECKRQVSGYPGALYKSFLTLEEAQAYLGLRPAAAPTARPAGRHFDIFVDGSYHNKRYGWGFVVYQDGAAVDSGCGAGEGAAAAVHNIAGELEAAMQAVKWARANGADAVTIHHDYSGISEWAEGRWKANNPVTREYQAFMAAHRDWVAFQKVAGHSGVAGNELADKLAGEALKEYEAKRQNGI